MNIEPAQIIEYITKTQPHLLALVIKQAKPYMLHLEERAQKVGYGVIDVKLHVRAGEIEKVEAVETHTWLKPKP